MRRGPSTRHQPTRDYDGFRNAYEEMLRMFDTGTKRQFLRAEKRFWKLAKDMEIVEGQWWRTKWSESHQSGRRSA